MAIVPLPLPPNVAARVLLHHLLERGDIVGTDTAGRTIIQLAVDDWALEQLMAFDPGAAELEGGDDDEPDADDEEVGPPVLIDLVRPKVVQRGMWGVAALTGPFVGGVFAELGVWRVAFWVLLPLVGGLAVLNGRVLGPVSSGETRMAAFPGFRLALLAVAVLSVSAASLAEQIWLNTIGMAAAAVLMAALARLDGAATERLLPRAAFRPATPLGATYATMVLLVVGTTTIIFVPLLLQVLHGLTPLAAGYLTVVEALGWTGAALATSAARRAGARQAIAAGPATMLVGLVGLSWSIPDDGSSLVAIAIWLLLVGAGIGMGWAHLASRVLALAPEGERDLAAASVSTVQLLATAFGSALAGMVANLAGLSDPGSVGAGADAARWLFAVFATAPALAGVAVFAILARPAAQPAGRGLPPS